TSRSSLVPTQDAYLPLSIQYNLDDITLNNPSDLTIDKDDNIYIADYVSVGSSYQGYIVKYNLNNDLVEKIGEGILLRPTGVHIGKDGNIYVADLQAKKAYKFVYNPDNFQYEVAVTYERPTNTPYFGANEVFEPTKIISDQGNVVY